jgi:hypothetical protein
MPTKTHDPPQRISFSLNITGAIEKTSIRISLKKAENGIRVVLLKGNTRGFQQELALRADQKYELKVSHLQQYFRLWIDVDQGICIATPLSAPSEHERDQFLEVR